MAKKLISDLERFLQNIEVQPNGCWLWIGPLDKDGYARQWRIGSHTDGSRGVIKPHRFAYEQFIGPIPEGLVIDHLCRNRPCCNPWHLEPVTTRENTQRGWRKNKAHCKHGHPLRGDNLIIHPNGWRNCRKCVNRLQKEHRQKNGRKYQRKYNETHREERRLAAAKRRADWTDERRAQELARGRIYDAERRRRRKSAMVIK